MSPTPTLRLADADTAGRYPLPVTDTALWRYVSGAWRVTLDLPELRPGTLLVPSLSFAGASGSASTGYTWSLHADDRTWALQTVPGPSPASTASADAAVSTHIDCFHVHRTLRAPELRLTLNAAAAPAHYLISVSTRALTVPRPPAPADSAGLAKAPAPRSQTDAPPDIAPRICSPTCVSMVLDLWQRPHGWLDLAAECHDPSSQLYGVWPLALAAAARRGCIGAVEAFDDWTAPLAVLARGVPLVASIRFAAGDLPGAPLNQTSGHLVMIYAADPASVTVCDPAAPAASVARSYDAAAFSRAWLSHRGAAYILPP